MKWGFGFLGTLMLGASASATLTFPGTNNYSTLSSSIAVGRVDAEIDLLSATDDLYLNSADIDTASTLGSILNASPISAAFSKFDGSGNFIENINYAQGTALEKGFVYRAIGAFDGLISFSNFGSVVAGTYTGLVSVFGGNSSTSTDLIGNVSVSVEVVDSFNLSMSYPQSNFVLTPGAAPQTLVHNVSNTGTRDFLLTSRYYSGNIVQPPELTINFSSTYPSRVDAGQSYSSPHLELSATGLFSGFAGNSGIIGGFYEDDINFLQVGGDYTVSAVPEPATIAFISLGVVATLRRRKKAS